MTLRVHALSPAEAIEAAFFRIQRENMADLPMLNQALCVEAIDFQIWNQHWLGMILTPWCMSMLLLPGSEAGWVSTGENQRRCVRLPFGDLAFLGSEEPELGEYQSCSLFSPMDRFSSQAEAVMTARASLLAALAPPAPLVSPEAGKLSGETSLSRRRFLALGRTAGR